MKMKFFTLSIVIMLTCLHAYSQVQPQTFTGNVASSYSMRLGQRDTTPGQLTIGSTEIVWRDSAGVVKDSLSIVARFGTVGNVNVDWAVTYYVKSSEESGEASLRRSNGVVRFTFIPSDKNKQLDGFELALSNITMN
jgi:hypothetical protein